MASISKFGQYVLLEVHDDTNSLVFSTDSLKIDFDVRHIPGWSRAKISLTNLTQATIRKLSNGVNYVTISTKLHDSPLQVVASEMFISNALEEVQVPNSIFNMYCYSKTRKEYLEKQIDITVEGASLRKVISDCVSAAKFRGVVEPRYFPPKMWDYVPPKPTQTHRGSLLTCLERLGKRGNYRFNVYTDGTKIVLMYKPSARNVSGTDLFYGKNTLKLSTSNLRANPKIGPASLSVISNLDPDIKPATLLDISNLLTIGTDVSATSLEVGDNYLKEAVAGFSIYQALSVQHKGSNWGDTWQTQVAATSPVEGTTMPTDKWWA